MKLLRKIYPPLVPPSSQTGFSLLEVIITVLIIAIGSLGMASFQLTALKYSSGSNTRTQAVLLASSMMDRIRANKPYAITDGAKYKINTFQSSSTSTNDCHQTVCTPVQIAEFDTSKWFENMSNLLPSGQGKIEFDTSTSTPVETTVTISIQWRQTVNNELNQDTAELKNFTYQSTL